LGQSDSSAPLSPEPTHPPGGEQIDVPEEVRFVNQRLQAQPDHERRNHEQPTIGYQRRVVEGRLDTVKRGRYYGDRKCLLGRETVLASRIVILPAREAVFAETSTEARPQQISSSVDRG
jgi:hypothetical protein